MAYRPIENYGVIGDLNTAALIALDGSVEFMCYPEFDSPTIFAKMLDDEKGGCFQIKPVNANIKHRQMYLPDTNVLLTRFLSCEGVGELTDFMPVEELNKGNLLLRRLTAIRGEVTYQMHCRPRFNYGRNKHKAVKTDCGLQFISEGDDKLILDLRSSVPIEIIENDGFAEFTLKPGDTADFLFGQFQEKKHSACPILQPFITDHLFETVKFWRSWIAQCKYQGRWMESVRRSALVLKLLTSERYGSVVAAPTFGLPEKVGGSFNWDYRYTWIRDAAFTIFSLLKLGYTREASAFMNWVEKKCEDIGNAGYLGLMYGINGRKDLEEMNLDHFDGYRGSKPVRIGNGAYEQIQLDIYGELMDSVFLYNKYGEPISYDFWNNLVNHINWLSENWQIGDQGIWEVRGGKRQFLYSRMMCWVAFDRAIKLGAMRSFPTPSHWRKVRDTIYTSIFDEFWCKKKNAFEQYPGAGRVDASSLLLPLIRFISPRDPRWLSTLAEIEKELVSDSLVYRYKTSEEEESDLVSGEGTFSICSFWYIECLSRSGQLQKARFYFDKMLAYANHVGLYSEQLGYQGEHLGNFPQAFTHLSLITAAINLNDRLDDARNRGFTIDEKATFG